MAKKTVKSGLKALTALGISHKLAQSWISQHGTDYVQQKLDILNSQNQQGRKALSVSGFLNAAITDDYKTDKPKGKTVQNGGQSKDTKEALDLRRNAIRVEAEDKASKAKKPERVKSERLAKTRKALAWFETLSPSEQTKLPETFEPALDKAYLKGDYKRGGHDAPMVADRFAAFVDL